MTDRQSDKQMDHQIVDIYVYIYPSSKDNGQPGQPRHRGKSNGLRNTENSPKKPTFFLKLKA